MATSQYSRTELVRRGLSQYFRRSEIVRHWKSIDGHILAICRSEGKQFVLKSPYPYSPGSYYARSRRSLEATASYLQSCVQEGLPVPCYFENRDGAYTTRIDRNRYAYLMKYIPHQEKLHLRIQDLSTIATIQAKLHLIAHRTKFPRLRRHRLTEIDFQSNLQRFSNLRTCLAIQLYEQGREKLAHYKQSSSSLPGGICHNDIGTANILRKISGDLAFIDFDFSDLNAFACDLAIAAKHLCLLKDSCFSILEIGPYLESYQRQRKLTEPELNVFHIVLLYTSYPAYAYARRIIGDKPMHDFVIKLRDQVGIMS